MSTLRVNTITDLAGTGAPVATYGIQGAVAATDTLELTSEANKIRFYYADSAALPSASTYHGMFAHVHGVGPSGNSGRAYVAHSGVWKELIDASGGQTISGSLTITGDLTISGTTTSINTTELDVKDSIVRLRTGQNIVAGVGGISVVQTTDGAGTVTSERTIRFNNSTAVWELTNDGTTYSTIATGISTSGDNTFTGSNTFTGRVDLQELREDVIDLTVTADAVTADYTTGAVYYVDASSATANLTADFTNLPTDNGKVINATLLVSQGSTGRIIDVVEIGGSAATIKWSGGAEPTATSTSGAIDIFGFTFIRRGSAWTVLGSSSTNFN